MDYPIRPVPIGLLTPTSGTPLQLTANFQTLYGDPGTGHGPANNLADAWFRRLDIRNVGTSRVYVGLKNLNKATFAGVIWYLDPGDEFTIENPQQAQPYHLG